MRASQARLILGHLKTGGSLTQTQASRLYKCGRLAARIYELRQQGEPISTEKVKTPHGATVARYRWGL